MSIDMKKWVVPNIWRGDGIPTFVLGGGPSLLHVDIDRLNGAGHVVCVNRSYELALFADVLYWSDRNFLEDHHRLIAQHQAKYKVTRIQMEGRYATNGQTLFLEHNPRAPLSRDPSKICGFDSGSCALNLAYLFGADPIVLCGFDMRYNGHWHEEHRVKCPPEAFASWYVPSITGMANELQYTGVKVYNSSPGSSLECFPFRDYEEFL